MASSLLARISRLPKANVPWIRLAALGVLLHFALRWSGFQLPQLRSYITIYIGGSLFYYLEEFVAVWIDPQEPPLIPYHGLPFLGHVIGMFYHGSSYWDIVNSKTQYPIFTLQTLTAKTIGVISPALAAQIQRASRNTSFYGMILEVTKRLVDFDEPSMAIIRNNMDGTEGPHGLMQESHAMVAAALSPGPGLNAMSATQLEQFTLLLNEQVSGSESVEISLFQFVKHIFTKANAYTIYGPKNPFLVHPELVPKFWDYEGGMVAVMANVFPTITARKPYYARKAVLEGLKEFIKKEHYKAASPMIQKRVAINLKHGLTLDMAGHAELILLFGIVGNAVPTTFWLLANVFSRPELLAQLREETSTAISSENNGKEKTINVTKLKTKCPLLVSTYRETLRTIANLASVRLVTNTHTISGDNSPYLLQKGSMCQIASGVIHVAPTVWGQDAPEFVPERFISSTTNSEQFSEEKISAERTATQLPKNVPSAAYRAFGGGSVICPGRHFAQSEIIGFLAAVISMFDVVGEDGKTLKLPKKDNRRIPLSVMKPTVEPNVKIRRRAREEQTVWKLEL